LKFRDGSRTRALRDTPDMISLVVSGIHSSQNPEDNLTESAHKSGSKQKSSSQKKAANATASAIKTRGLEDTKRLIESINRGVLVRSVICNLSDEASVQNFIYGTVEQFRRIDYAANVAGITVLGLHTAKISTSFFEQPPLYYLSVLNVLNI
jgi:NAD(P)-dependent dehydrogenase (short-subunit alcohol dehydrogenase family)